MSAVTAIRCGGHESCFPLAFGLPAALMLTATILFVLGSPKYKNLPLQENAIFRVAEMIYVSASKEIFVVARKKENLR